MVIVSISHPDIATMAGRCDWRPQFGILTVASSISHFLLFISNFSILIRFDSFAFEEEGRFERLGRGSHAPAFEHTLRLICAGFK